MPKISGRRTAVFRGLVGSAFLALVACVPTSSDYLYKSNADVARADSDDYTCELEAAKAVPASMRVGTTPTYTTPSHTNCYRVGNSVQCTTTGGQTYGGDTYSYDANNNLRKEYYARCMAAKGWSAVSLPNCNMDKVPVVLKTQLVGKLRAPAEGACYVPITKRAGNIVYASELLK